MKDVMTKVLFYIKSNPKSQVLSYLYLLLVAIGLILALLSYFIPSLMTCMTIFEGDKVCSPFGFYLAAFPSFPGYIVLSLVMMIPQLQSIPAALSLLLVGGFSLFFYYGVGRLFDNKVYKRLPKMNTVTWISVVSFAVFLLLFLVFSLALQ